MLRQRFLAPALLLGAALAGGLIWVDAARGGPREDAALKKVQEEGALLWKKPWSRTPGAKTCATCHDRGPNKLTKARMEAWPKYDRFLRKVATVQEKLAQMIEKQCKGTAPALGSAELTALEAYIKTR